MGASPPQPPGYTLPAPAAQHMSLTTRALLAVGLLVGFYLLALGLAAVLLYIPYAEWEYANRLHTNVLIFCCGGALAILWAIIPRLDKFPAPGPRLDARDQPRLLQTIDAIAALTGQPAPAEVYLVSDVNAWVADRGGAMGFGARRVMGLGLPLLQTLSIAELRAVLAHEFGHFFAGDTRLGPWIYRTRSAIARTLENLHGSLLQQPFIAYAKLFLRVSQAVSRKQEYAADALARAHRRCAAVDRRSEEGAWRRRGIRLVLARRSLAGSAQWISPADRGRLPPLPVCRLDCARAGCTRGARADARRGATV